MTPPEWLFWASAACVAYPYLIYPALLRGRVAVFGGRPLAPTGDAPRSVSMVVAAYNEEANVARRLDEMLARVASSGAAGEVVLVSDGSTDRTAEVARGFAGRGVRVVELPANRGKAAALSEGCAAATGEVLVFADARQTWAEDALPLLLENFADPAVGAVSGDLVLGAGSGSLAGVGVYWKFEKWLRKLEARVHSTVGVTGAICAVRRGLFRPIPAGTILDDVYWPLGVVMQGYRVVHDGRARAFDRLPDRAGDEFRRKVRTLSGNFQLVARMPATLLPWRNPVCWQFVSHKLSRLLAPWGLIGMFAAGAALGGVYRAAFLAQAAGYLLAAAGLWTAAGSRSRLASAAASFAVLNAAAWVSFWVWATGRAARSWNKVAYVRPPLTETAGRP